MRVTNVALRPEGSTDFLTLSYRDPRRLARYNVKSIVGLDADEIVPRFYGGTSSKFYDLSLLKREVTILIELCPRFSEGESYSDLRDRLYKMISASRTGTVQLRFNDSTTTMAVLTGQFIKFEASHFSKTPEIQLTLKAKNGGMLTSLNPVSIDVTGLDPGNTVIQDDLSTALHGFKFELRFTDNLHYTIPLVINDPDDSTWSFSIQLFGGFVSGDVIRFSNEPGDKYLTLDRLVGGTIQIADSILNGSIWPMIFPGTTTLQCLNTSDLEWVSITHHPTYWGV